MKFALAVATVLMIVPAIALAQTQSHPLSQVTPIDTDLNMNNRNISSLNYLLYSGGIFFSGSQGIPTADRNVVRVKDGSPKAYRASTSLERIVKSYVESRREDIEYATESGKWLGEIADAMGPTVRRHKSRVRVFEPKYARG
jgi:hypothetical protein